VGGCIDNLGAEVLRVGEFIGRSFVRLGDAEAAGAWGRGLSSRSTHRILPGELDELASNAPQRNLMPSYHPNKLLKQNTKPGIRRLKRVHVRPMDPGNTQ